MQRVVEVATIRVHYSRTLRWRFFIHIALMYLSKYKSTINKTSGDNFETVETISERVGFRIVQTRGDAVPVLRFRVN